MLNFLEYKKLMRENINFKEMAIKYPKVYMYWTNLEESVLSSTSHCSSESFWNDIYILLEADSKFIILKDLIDGGFFDQEIIDIVNSDFYYLTKELCGYNVNQTPHNSIIFLECSDNKI